MNRTEALAQFKQELAQAIKEKLSTMSRKEKSDLFIQYWKKHTNPTYYKLDFISLQPVPRKSDWVDIHRKDLDETIPLIKAIQQDPKVLNTIKIESTCEF